MYKVFIIRAIGQVEVSEQPKAPSLQQMQDSVAGYIETCPYFTKFTWEGITYKRGKAFCNEEGFMRRLPHNVKATEAWLTSCPTGDRARMQLLGDVLFYAKVPK